jgi:hypothetical protein
MELIPSRESFRPRFFSPHFTGFGAVVQVSVTSLHTNGQKAYYRSRFFSASFLVAVVQFAVTSWLKLSQDSGGSNPPTP